MRTLLLSVFVLGLSVAIAVALFFAWWLWFSVAQNARSMEASSRAQQSIAALLERQVDAWNRGDSDGYLDAYARNEGVWFVVGDREVCGFAEAKDRLLSRHPSGREMGRLSMEELRIQPLGQQSRSAVAHGRWELSRGDLSESLSRKGVFTLKLEVMAHHDPTPSEAERWYIVREHRSGSEADPTMGG